jgi:hypothetical protein
MTAPFTNRIRSISRLLAVVTAVLAVLAVNAPAADAAYITSGGRPGPVYVPRANCAFNNAWGTLTLSTNPPTIYAPNRYSGAGNDRRLVRYRVSVVNLNTGQTVASTALSGWAWAWDNYPAQFSGVTTLRVDWRYQYSLRYRVNWYNRYGTRTGYAIHRADAYNYYQGGIGPFGPLSVCMQANF